MGLTNLLLLVQVTIFLMSLIISFFMFVPISVNLDDFDGNCLLFATGKWSAKEGAIKLISVDWGNGSACNFAVFTGVAVMLTSIFYLLWYSVLLYKNVESSWLDAFVCGGITFILTIFTFASALTISEGFRDWCTLVTDPKASFDSCEDGDYIPFGQYLNINTRHFYTEYQMAQFGAWTLWICQLSLLILSVVKLCRYHSQEAFLTSMHRERQRLIQRVQNQSSYTAAPVPT